MISPDELAKLKELERVLKRIVGPAFAAAEARAEAAEAEVAKIEKNYSAAIDNLAGQTNLRLQAEAGWAAALNLLRRLDKMDRAGVHDPHRFMELRGFLGRVGIPPAVPNWERIQALEKVAEAVRLWYALTDDDSAYTKGKGSVQRFAAVRQAILGIVAALSALATIERGEEKK